MSVLSISEYKADIRFFHEHAKLCPHCDYPVEQPYRRYNEKGKAIAGCIHPCHDKHVNDQAEMQSIRMIRLGIANHIIEASYTTGQREHNAATA